MTSTLVRTANSPIKQFNFNNNTVYTNVGGLNFQYSQHVVATNNIFYNCGLTGSLDISGGIIRVDSIKTGVVGMTDADRTFDFRNNLFYREKRYSDIQVLPGSCPNNAQIDSIFHPNVIPFINNGQFKIDGLRREPVPFTNAPQQVIAYLQFWWSKCLVSTISLASGETMPIFAADEKPLEIGEVTGTTAFNFGYPQTSPLATAGLGGKPLGDTNWLPFYTGINNRLTVESNIKVFMNNSTKTLKVFIANENATKATIKVYGINGSLIYSNNNLQVDPQQMNVQLPPLSTGMYGYVLTFDNSKCARGKFIVE